MGAGRGPLIELRLPGPRSRPDDDALDTRSVGRDRWEANSHSRAIPRPCLPDYRCEPWPCLLAIKRERDCRYTLHTLLPDGTAPPLSRLPCRTLARTIKRVFQRAVPLQATAEAAESTITQARPTLVTGDPGARDRPDATDARVAHLEAEVLKLGGRCRAHEHALECLSRAVLTLRRANRALTEENSILRLELERLRGRAVART